MKAIVTGASSGIGRDMAIYLGKLGYDLVLVSRDVNRLKETASKIDTNVEIYPADLSNKENCFKLHDKYKDEEIDFLVNGAGFGLFGDTWETDINKEMVRSGHAIVYLESNYHQDQAYAKSKKLGIWNGDFIHPRLFRRLKDK